MQRRRASSSRKPSDHPRYATAEQIRASEDWLLGFCRTADCPGFIPVITRVAKMLDGTAPRSWDKDYMHFVDENAHGDIPMEFWHHAEIVFGCRIKRKPKYFSCQC